MFFALALAVAVGLLIQSVITVPVLADSGSSQKAAVRPPAIHAESAIVIDMNSGQILYSHDANTCRRMASTTKIMTALIVLKNMRLDQVVTVSAHAASTPPQSVGLRAGDRVTVGQLLYGALVWSGNDAAEALAEAGGGGSEKAFVAKMNRMAASLGLTNTHFVNPHGLDAPGQYSTARDLAKLARYAMQNAQFRKIVSTDSYTIKLPGREPFVLHNVNKLVRTVDWVTGVKTGSTSQAGYCLVASGTRNGERVLSVVLGEPTSDLNWSESKALLEYGFARN